jgi:hypothetical protein
LGSLFILSGEAYRGRAIDGLGGGIGRSVLFSGPPADPAAAVLGLNDAGGWAQLKFKPGERFEINRALGQDSTFAADVPPFPTP